MAINKMNEAPEILTLREAADYLRIHEQTMYRLAQSKQVKQFFKVGGQWRIRRADIDGLCIVANGV